mmetsp:Transcript_44463/g.32567  ORF Transcript_44463/g.32567 Transcript_44463/m.32567 type:complete len:82 (-) Transcript_44463:82-327(-)
MGKVVPGPDDKFPAVFMFKNEGPRLNSVQLCGSFDNWQGRHSMSFDDNSHHWFLTFHLKKGTYHYKYIKNGKDWVVNNDEK